MVLGQLDIHMKRVKLDLSFTLQDRLTKWIMDLNVKAKIMSLCDLMLGKASSYKN